MSYDFMYPLAFIQMLSSYISFYPQSLYYGFLGDFMRSKTTTLYIYWKF